MKLQELMVRDVVQAAPHESIGVAGKRMRESGVGCLVITVAGTVKGIITDRDLLACLAQAHDPYRCQISNHMHRPVHVLRPEEDHVTAAAVMHDTRVKRLPIAQNGKLLGIVSLSDLALIASIEALQLRASLNFFTAVVRTQAAQKGSGTQAEEAAPQKSRLPASTTNNDQLASFNGGPG
jgi:CBS domain-containing protein